MYKPFFFAFATLVLFVGFPHSPADADDPALGDAGLHDLFFVNARQGWAVGERGAIWHTENGGMSWELQPSLTVCSLRSVWFVDEKTGWIAGGQGLPFSPASSGLVLATRDGGRQWQPVSWQQVPRLHRIQFLNARSGWACGESSEFYPTGLFSSESGGQTWTPADGSIAGRGWLSGFFHGRDAGVLGGFDGVLGLVSERTLRPVALGSLGSRSIRRVTFGNDTSAWAVGDGGLVMLSQTKGASWSLATGQMPAEAQAVFDWRGVAATLGQVWIVGRPGSVVMTSIDSGRTWQSFPTGQSAPLEAVWFQDRRQGWAVGALGTILATQDGGRSWQVQRRGGERAALLAVHGAAGTAPLLLHAQLGADQGYFSADLAIANPRHESDDSARAGLESRLADAVAAVGGVCGESEWRFPTSPMTLSLGQVLDDWNRRSEGKALQELERRLVVAIRTWRPEVIVTDAPDPAAARDAAGALASQALERAFKSAADVAAFPELVEQAKLEPWSAKKLFAAAPGSSAADAHVEASTLARTTGRPLDELAGLATALLAESHRASDAELRYRLVTSRLPAGKPDSSIMAGIVLEPGGPARRQLAPAAEFTDAARHAEQTRRNVIALVDRANAQPALARQLNAQLDGLLREISPEQAGNVLVTLAGTHFKQGRWGEARELYEKLVHDHPQHLASAEAHRWLVQFYSSSEARHRERAAGAVGELSSQPAAPLKPEPKSRGKGEPDADTPRGRRDMPKSRAETPTPSVSSRQSLRVGGAGGDVPWAKGALETAKRLLEVSPLAWSDPQVQFPLAAAHRALGNSKDAERFYTTFGLGRESGPWVDAARGERWIRDRQGMPPKPVLVSRRTATPPYLDGSLDDPVWKEATPATLVNLQRTEAGEWETKVRVAHDARFLYLAFSCYAAGSERVAPIRPRQRDADLAANDQVHFYFDLDRDFATYYHLAADQRGCVFDDCWGDQTWNPTWYVASQNDEHGYRIEAAVPLAELTSKRPQDGTVWSFNAVRVVPGERIMAWSRPAGLAPRPEGFGYLFFSDGPLAPPPRSAVAN